jgi:pimeloyl-ACP methyl ester carboxylesterase
LGAFFFVFAAIQPVACTSWPNLPRPVPAAGTARSFFIANDGTKLFISEYQAEYRDNATIYIIGGITGMNHQRDGDVVAALGGSEYRVMAMHPRGTGYSLGDRGDESTDELVADHVEWISRDRRVNDKVVLFGHSMSTAIALAVARQLNELDGIILVNPPYKTKRSPGMSPTFREMMRFIGYFVFARHKPVIDMAGDARRIENTQEANEAAQRACDPFLTRYHSLAAMQSVRRQLKSMHTFAESAHWPLLLIYGNADSLVDRAGVDAIFRAWQTPQKTYLEIEDGPHGKATVLMASAPIREWISHLHERCRTIAKPNDKEPEAADQETCGRNISRDDLKTSSFCFAQFRYSPIHNAAMASQNSVGYLKDTMKALVEPTAPAKFGIPFAESKCPKSSNAARMATDFGGL